MLTQKRIAFVVSAFSAIALFAMLLAIYYIVAPFTTVLFLAPFGVFLVSYFLTLQTVEKFVYRKIKTLYKLIHTLKKTDVKIKSDDPDILEKISTDVEEFSKKQAGEMEQLRRMETYRRNFLGNVSHELKTPIFNIQGYLDTLLDGGLEDSTINRDYLERAVKNTERISKIVEDLVFISLHEAGEVKLLFEKFHIYELVQTVFEELDRMARAKNITLHIKDNVVKSFQVYADKEKIYIVLHNLILNAIKYGKENGKILVGFYEINTEILVEVTDDGIGIEEAHLPHLFERFYRVDKARSRDEGGTGLGLSIVKHIIDAHHQAINVRSTIGVGTTFGFTLKKG